MKRLQRLRQNVHIRDLTSQIGFTVNHLIQPLFAVEGIKHDGEIEGLKGTKRLSITSTLKQIESDLNNGVTQFILFGVPAIKMGETDYFYNHDFTTKVISEIREKFGRALHLWVDTCLCSVTSHGHCCVFHQNGQIHSEKTLDLLSQSALKFTQAGADGISPSDMMDGRVKAIRETLDAGNYLMTPIMSYSTKFASQLYGPFRNAASSAPQFGDRTQYQIDVRNRQDAISSSIRCAEEGADLLMVKPAMPSLDLIQPIAEKTNLPVGAYQVSGEYAGLVALEKAGLIDFNKGLLETWYVLKRGGAQFIITYGARYAKSLGVGLK